MVGFTYFAKSPHKCSAEMTDRYYIDDSMAALQWNVKYDHDEVKSMIRITNKSEAAAQDGHCMKTKLILKYMYNNDYTIKLKARLVACGYSQI